MNVQDRVVLLVGPPCTGAEWLGLSVLSRDPGVEVVGRVVGDPGSSPPAHDAGVRLGEYICRSDGIDFDFDHARALLGEMLSGLVDAPETDETGTIVLCEPGFGHGGYVDRLLIARRLRRVFGRCRVVITVTDPIEAVAAFHSKVRALDGVGQPIDTWVRGCSGYRHYDGRARDYPLTNARFGELAEAYGRLFGAASVHVVSVEAICGDMPSGSLAGLARFLRVESALEVPAVPPAGQPARGSGSMSASTRAWLTQYYAADQALLRRIVGG